MEVTIIVFRERFFCVWVIGIAGSTLVVIRIKQGISSNMEYTRKLGGLRSHAS